MTWETILLLQIGGTAATVAVVGVVILLGIRYRRELPKLPIKTSIEALRLQEREISAQVDECKENLWDAKQTIEEGEKQRTWLDQNEERIRDLAERLRELQAAEKALEEAEDGKAKIDEQVQRLLREKVEFQATLDAQAEDMKKLEGLKEERSTLEEAVPQLREKLRSLEESTLAAGQLRNQMYEQQDTLRKELAEIEGRVRALTSERDALLEHLKALRTDVQAAGGVDADADPCEDLWKPYFAERRPSGGDDDELRRLRSLHADLSNAGVQLPERTLYAFHTALKAQDSSPLTVLAGISGTGKSLLPRMYARAIGMYFLNLPIQPRWDSPQDLFGFYNYIEHKYKATDLARAMIQFNLYRGASWPTTDAPDLSDQMLLVLLDEMNLARIEYYFSELLSRLEIRRDIDPDNQEERAQVEVALEIGHGHQGRGDVRIFPGGNVLFAGTMNEDESTQALSEKVLDRASVLRFGRPTRTLTTPPELADFAEGEALSAKTWEVWKGSRNETAITTTAEVIQQLNDLMDRVGSPFGHRTSHGIANYVAMYPNRTAEGTSFAIADQIEQKILPKLRGLDLEADRQHFEDLMRIVDSLDDNALLNELRKRVGDGNGPFMWRGLDRSEDLM